MAQHIDSDPCQQKLVHDQTGHPVYYIYQLSLEVGDEGEGAEAKDFLYVDAFNGGKAMSCFEVMELVKRLAGNDVSISDECFMAVATPRQVCVQGDHGGQELRRVHFIFEVPQSCPTDRVVKVSFQMELTS